MTDLDGLRIVVTRAAHQAEELARPLRELGAEVLLLPVIGIAPPLDPEPLRNAAAQVNCYDWIIFTSVNAVKAFAEALPVPPAAFRTRVAAVGPATRAAALEQGFAVSLMPSEYVAESLIASFDRYPLAGQRVLIPSAAVTRDIVPKALENQGALVNAVIAYRNVLPAAAAEAAARIFGERLPHWVTFASPSAVDNTLSVAGIDVLARLKIASIGPVTSEAVRRHGLTVTVEAAEHNVPGLVETLWQYEFSRPR